MKKEFILPIGVLSLICLCVTGVLAISHNITQPLIMAAAAERAALAKREMIPAADAFVPVVMDFPSQINAVYRTTNNMGYIFIVTVGGFGGDMRIMSGIDPDGYVIRTMVLSHSETPTFAAPVFAESFAGQFWGQDIVGVERVGVIAGSTITANAYRNAVQHAFAAWDFVTTGAPIAIPMTIDQFVTAPSAQRTELAKMEIMPTADGFLPVQLPGLPDAVEYVYRAFNGTGYLIGYIFVVSTPGYGGEMRIMSGINQYGRVIRSLVLAHSETPPFAAPVFAESFAGQFWGQDIDGVEGVGAVAGSTVTADALRNAIIYAFAAFEVVSGGSL